MANKISHVIFHWSESVVITTTIDPTFQKIMDADYKICLKDAEALIDEAVKELAKFDRFVYETCVTLCLRDGRQLPRTIEIKQIMPSLQTYVINSQPSF